MSETTTYNINEHARLLAEESLDLNKIPYTLLPLDEVAVINQMVGNTFNDSFKGLSKQVSIIRSELDEAQESVDIGNMEGLQDDIMDLFFTVTGLLWRSGTWNNARTTGDWQAVINSQWSKFDFSEEEWLKTKAKYDAYGMEVEYVVKQYEGKDYYITLSAKDQLDEKARNCSKGKWLKSYKFKDVTLSPLPSIVDAKSSYNIIFEKIVQFAIDLRKNNTDDLLVSSITNFANSNFFSLFPLDSRYSAIVDSVTLDFETDILEVTVTYHDKTFSKPILNKTLTRAIPKPN